MLKRDLWILVVAAGFVCLFGSGCAAFRGGRGAYQAVLIQPCSFDGEAPRPRAAEDTIRRARTLSKAGRHGNAAKTYLRAAKRFESKSGRFEMDCQMSAVKEYWLAGDLVKARKLLTKLQTQSDIYARAAAHRGLRELDLLLSDAERLRRTQQNHLPSP